MAVNRGIIRKTGFSVVLAVFLIVGTYTADAMMMNGKEVKPYVGKLVAYNARTGQVEIQTSNSRGHWRLSSRTIILYGRERLSFSDIWTKTREVEAYVSRDGEIQRITVLQWR